MTGDVGAQYLEGLRDLDPDERRTLASVTIVGMRHYPGAYDAIVDGTYVKHNEDSLLFLVADANGSGVILHNGARKLGIVQDSEKLRKVLDKWKVDNHGIDDVIICVTSGWRERSSFKSGMEWQDKVTLVPWKRVNERLARKYSDKVRKEKENGK